MKKRRDAKANGRNSRDKRDFYYEMEFMGQLPPPAPSRRKILGRKLSPLLGVALLGVSIGFAFVVATQDLRFGSRQSIAAERAEPFRWAVNRAVSAAELTQKANSVEEWKMVAQWWQEAIELMREVPSSYARYNVAQARIPEYERNLQYAQRKLEESTRSASGNELWSVGSRRAEVMDIQGKPSSTDRYDSMCKEVLRYGKSVVELRNGMVVRYEDFDRNLRVTPKLTPAPSNRFAWGLGSTKNEVFAVQGTPSRVVQYEYSKKELLYYSNSTIELMDDRVTGYRNLSSNLRVQISPTVQTSNQPFWTMNSMREDIFEIQGTPTQVDLDDSTCTETLNYGDSTIELKNGFIAGYDNIDGNLRVRVE